MIHHVITSYSIHYTKLYENKVTPKLIESLKKAEEYVDVVVVGKKIEGFECIESDSIEPRNNFV